MRAAGVSFRGALPRVRCCFYVQVCGAVEVISGIITRLLQTTPGDLNGS